MKNGIFVLVFLASALTRIFLLGSAPERLVKSLGQDLTCAVFSDQNYENENGNQYDLYIPAGLDRTQDQNLILYIHGGSFNSGSKADGETWCRYYAAQGYITASVDYTLQMHGKDASVYHMYRQFDWFRYSHPCSVPGNGDSELHDSPAAEFQQIRFLQRPEGSHVRSESRVCSSGRTGCSGRFGNFCAELGQ